MGVDRTRMWEYKIYELVRGQVANQLVIVILELM